MGDARVDTYLAAQPDEQRAALIRLRGQIAALVPEAEETISYGMPTFRLHGRGLLWIAGWKAHCSIYPLTDAFLRTHRVELAGYRRSKGTLRFPPGAPPPDALIEALVRARVAEVESEVN